MNASLRDLARRVDALPTTHFDAADLMRQGEARRQRRRVAAVAGAAVALVVAVGLTGTALSGDERAQVPAHNPSPSQTAPTAPGEAWTLERIRAEGTAEDGIPTTESGLTTRQYSVCDGPRCDGRDGPPVDMHVAIEVAQNGRSALFGVRGTGAWVTVFDENTVLVQDTETEDLDQPARARLLRADGTAVQLRLLDDPAPAVPRPGVVVNDFSVGWSIGLSGAEELAFVDDRAGTMQPITAPADVRYWGPNLTEFLWGVSDDCRAFWATAGSFRERRLDCSKGADFTYLVDELLPAGWLRPGRMVVIEQNDAERPDETFVHVSLDRGTTWQRIPVNGEAAIPNALRDLG